ncbi:hypothetical protein [Streptomyces sp. NPDC006134]|uniref:hypothetical protein n=1 Tax=Streptomyces sp. NPDC006134 TaxID=3154467 RepID=UPI0033D95353
MGVAVFDRCASEAEDLVGGLLGGVSLWGAAGVEAGDDRGVEYVVVQAAEAEVRQRTEADGAQVGQDMAVAARRRSWITNTAVTNTAVTNTTVTNTTSTNTTVTNTTSTSATALPELLRLTGPGIHEQMEAPPASWC